MSGEVLAFPKLPIRPSRETLLAAVTELHALLTLDRSIGASPVRTYFVLNPVAREKIEEALDPNQATASLEADMLALIAYDFPFALFQFQSESQGIAPERAKAIITLSSELQEEVLGRTAAALGFETRALEPFDAESLKRVFFPSTQETVTHVFGLSLRP